MPQAFKLQFFTCSFQTEGITTRPGAEGSHLPMGLNFEPRVFVHPGGEQAVLSPRLGPWETCREGSGQLMNGFRQGAEQVVASAQQSPLTPQECYQFFPLGVRCLCRLTWGPGIPELNTARHLPAGMSLSSVTWSRPGVTADAV